MGLSFLWLTSLNITLEGRPEGPAFVCSEVGRRRVGKGGKEVNSAIENQSFKSDLLNIVSFSNCELHNFIENFSGSQFF